MKKILCALLLITAFVFVFASCNEAQAPQITISEDGYWVINGEKTDVKAQGEQGIQGEKGDKGENATATDENPLGLAFFLKDDGTYAVEIGQAKYLSKIEIPATYKGKAVTEVGVFGNGGGLGVANSVLKEIAIPNSVTTIGNSAFSGCTALTSVTIPDSVTSIGDDAFRDCTALTSVTIPDSVASIGNNAFWGCSNITTATMPTTAIFAIPKTNLTTVVLTSGDTIEDDAFRFYTSLTSVTIGDGVTSIGNNAFSYCKNLTSVAIGDSVTTIGDSAFEMCTVLTSVTIGDSVTSIGKWAFVECTALTSVTIGDSVTSIGKLAFCNCSSLTSITIPDSVTSIGNSAFYNCSSLTSVTIPDSVTSIGDEAFEYCYNLTDVYYTGSEADWAQITIGSYNSYLTNATIHYNYVPEE